METPDDACANAEFLLQVLDEVTLSIFMSAEACPKYVPRYFFLEIVNEKRVNIEC